MLFVVRDTGCEGVFAALVERCGCMCARLYWRDKPIAESMFFPQSFWPLIIRYILKNRMYSSAVFSFFPECAHGTHKCTHVCTHQTPDLVFLLSRRGMNKTGAQRLSEEQRETRVVAGRSLCSSGGVFVPQSPCLDLQDYSSLDADCSENSHSFFFFFFFWANLSVQTCAHPHKYRWPSAHTPATPRNNSYWDVCGVF